MAQIISIGPNCAKRKVARGIRKNEAEDHSVQPIGDIVGVFEDKHIFSPTEKDIFEIISVPGLSKSEAKAEMVPADSELTPGLPKFQFSISNLTLQQKMDLSSELTFTNTKKMILQATRK